MNAERYALTLFVLGIWFAVAPAACSGARVPSLPEGTCTTLRQSAWELDYLRERACPHLEEAADAEVKRICSITGTPWRDVVIEELCPLQR